jgi:hypothetical protein
MKLNEARTRLIESLSADQCKLFMAYMDAFTAELFGKETNEA